MKKKSLSEKRKRKNCLTCIYEPEWFEHEDMFNKCPCCNTHTVGICKKLADVVPVMGQPAEWPEVLRLEWVWIRPEYPGDVFRYDKKNPFLIDCPAHQCICSKMPTEL